MSTKRSRESDNLFSSYVCQLCRRNNRNDFKIPYRNRAGEGLGVGSFCSRECAFIYNRSCCGEWEDREAYMQNCYPRMVIVSDDCYKHWLAMKPNQDIQQLILLCRANLPHRDAQIANEEDREGGIYELNMNYRCNPLKRIK